MAEKREIDAHSGMETTGHEWDGIRELNTPLPRWWLWTFLATIVWAVGYMIAMPAVPLVDSFTKGMLGYSSRGTVKAELQEAAAAQQVWRDKIAATDLAAIEQDPELFNFALAGGRSAFGVNCAQCHGSGAAGSKGYPNLNDDDWLWGGSLEQIHQTLTVGIRSTHAETRVNVMAAYLKDGILTAAQVADVAEYVLSLSGQATDPVAAERGLAVFAEQCVACHQEGGTGSAELGAPDLTDAVWLFGGSKADIVQTVSNGRGGVMPSWAGKLSPETLKMLTVYVHALGGGE